MTSEELIAIQERYMAAVDSLLPWSKTAVDVPVLVAEVERLWDHLAAAADVIDSREGAPMEYVNESNEHQHRTVSPNFGNCIDCGSPIPAPTFQNPAYRSIHHTDVPERPSLANLLHGTEFDGQFGPDLRVVDEMFREKPKPHVNGPCWCGYRHNYPAVDLRVGDDELDRSEREGTHGR